MALSKERREGEWRKKKNAEEHQHLQVFNASGTDE